MLSNRNLITLHKKKKCKEIAQVSQLSFFRNFTGSCSQNSDGEETAFPVQGSRVATYVCL
jgi:hypothetical protein